MKIFTAFLTIVMSFVGIAAQTTQGGGSQFDAAVEAFESGEYEQTISLLAAYEKSKGTSPRLESLRALAYRDLEKPKEAHQAVLVYLRLTANRNMSSSEAHQDMLKLRDEMLEAIEKKYEEDKEKLDKERDEVATSIVQELEGFYNSPQIKRSYSSALPASLKTEADDANGEYIGPPPTESKAAPGMDALAELEMWRKINQSTVAMDYFLFIESFPNGQFTQIARKKMMDIGDPAWNAIKDSFDPFVYREYIKNNPDSPFLRVAKTTMDALAQLALKWEQVKDSNNEEELRNIESWFPKSPYAAEARKIRSEIAWRKIENLSSPAVFKNYLSEFPESPCAPQAKAAIERLQPKSVGASVATGRNGSASNPSPITERRASSASSALAKFSGVKFEVAKDAQIWSEFTVLSPCSVRVNVYSSVVTYPIKDEIVLDLRSVAATRAKKGRWWSTEIDHVNGKFDITRSTFTRNPAWAQVKETFPFSLKSLSIAAFSDELTASELATEVARLAEGCKRT